MAKAVRRSAPDDKTAACAQVAIDAFDKAVPDALLLRHIHEHLDEYIAGTGNQQSELLADFKESAIGLLDDGPVYFLGRKLFVISDIVTAAETSADTVGRCMGDGPSEDASAAS